MAVWGGALSTCTPQAKAIGSSQVLLKPEQKWPVSHPLTESLKGTWREEPGRMLQDSWAQVTVPGRVGSGKEKIRVVGETASKYTIKMNPLQHASLRSASYKERPDP